MSDRWTTKRPTEAGFYWVRWKAGGTDIVRVFEWCAGDEDDGELWVEFFGRDDEALNECDGVRLWAPVAEPSLELTPGQLAYLAEAERDYIVMLNERDE